MQGCPCLIAHFSMWIVNSISSHLKVVLHESMHVYGHVPEAFARLAKVSLAFTLAGGQHGEAASASGATHILTTSIRQHLSS